MQVVIIKYAVIVALVSGVTGRIGSPYWKDVKTLPYNHQVQFQPPFHKSPSVVIGLTQLDVGKEANVRVTTSAANVSPTGFTATFNTWGDTHIYSAYINWMACA